jgi:hypothetical protein
MTFYYLSHSGPQVDGTAEETAQGQVAAERLPSGDLLGCTFLQVLLA